MKLKNKDILPILKTLLVFASDKDAVPAGGLMTEKMSLGLKRRLQKIREALLKQYKELQKDAEALEKTEDKKKEIDVLMEESFDLLVEPASLAMIEAIETEAIYDMNTVEKFSV